MEPNNEIENLYWLSLDPGEKTTGYAAFDEQGNDLEFGKISGGIDAFLQWIEGLDPKPQRIIYENYRINPTISHGFSKVLVVQLIGMIKSYAKRNRIPLHEQSNTVLKIGLRYIGCYTVYYDSRGKKKKHVDDGISALAHGVYYLQSHKIRKSRIAK